MTERRRPANSMSEETEPKKGGFILSQGHAIAVTSEALIQAFSLPKTVSTILDNLTAPGNEPAEEVAVLENNMRQALLILPSGHTAVLGTMKMLETELKIKGGTLKSASPPRLARLFGAYLIASAVSHQATLPIEERGVRGTVKKFGHSDYNMLTEPNDGPLKNPLQEFEEKVEPLLEDEPNNERRVNLQVNLINAMQRARGSMRALFLTLASPHTFIWYSKQEIDAMERVNNNEISYYLLCNNQIEQVNEDIRYEIWVRALRVNEADALRYFFSHHEVQQKFFQSVVERRSLVIRTMVQQVERELKDGIKETEIGSATVTEEKAVQIFLLQDPEHIGGFFEAVSTYEGEDQREVLFRRLVSVASMIKTDFPDHPYHQAIIEHLKALSQTLQSSQRFSGLLSVVSDTSPGVIYYSVNREPRASAPRIGETEEEFLSEQKKAAHHVLYTSQAPWPEAQRKQATEKPVLKLEAGETVHLQPWGEVQISRTDDIVRILDWLQAKILKMGPNEDALMTLVDRYGRATGSGKGDIILPDLLPADHPLYQMRTLGVLAVDHRDDEVWFILDTKKADLQTAGSRRILLKGTLAQNYDLELSGALPAFTYSPLHLIFNAAALWGRTSHDDSQLTKEQQSFVNAALQDWKQIAKEHGFPLLSHVGNSARESNADYVRLPIGKNTVFLGFI